MDPDPLGNLGVGEPLQVLQTEDLALLDRKLVDRGPHGPHFEDAVCAVGDGEDTCIGDVDDIQ